MGPGFPPRKHSGGGFIRGGRPKACTEPATKSDFDVIAGGGVTGLLVAMVQSQKL